jgi:hypothetical protein
LPESREFTHSLLTKIFDNQPLFYFLSENCYIRNHGNNKLKQEFIYIIASPLNCLEYIKQVGMTRVIDLKFYKMRLYKIIMVILLFAGSSSLIAQKTKVYLGLGGIYNAFQDTRFSDVQFSKTSIIPELGFSRISEKDYWHANANFSYFNYEFPNLDTISYFNLAYNVKLGYLRNLLPSFFLGVNWDVLDYYKRHTDFLNNASEAYKLSSDIYVSGKYIWNMNEDWQFNFGLDVGLFSFVNTEPSFSANYQQNIIDKGEVTLIDSDTKLPYKLSNMAFKPFWEQFNIRTLVELNFRRRFSLNYAWDLRTYSDNKGYPVSNARHILTLRSNFVNHP